jgi:hypothetical protein
MIWYDITTLSHIKLFTAECERTPQRVCTAALLFWCLAADSCEKRGERRNALGRARRRHPHGTYRFCASISRTFYQRSWTQIKNLGSSSFLILNANHFNGPGSQHQQWRMLHYRIILWLDFYLTLNTQPATSIHTNSHSTSFQIDSYECGSCVSWCRRLCVIFCQIKVKPQCLPCNILNLAGVSITLPGIKG